MSNSLPLVSVIVPTTEARAEYHGHTMLQYVEQDYPRTEIIHDYESGNVGEKRNRLCKEASGDIIVHFDDDDFYAPDWISRSVAALMESVADIVGLSSFNLIDTINGAAYKYTYPIANGSWVAGATLAYWRRVWECNPFPGVNIGEDNGFLMNARPKFKVHAHNYVDGFICGVHGGNTSKKLLIASEYRQLPPEQGKIIAERYGII